MSVRVTPADPAPSRAPISNPTAWIHCRMPMYKRWNVVLHTRRGSAGTLTLVWSSAARWRRQPEALDAGWLTLRLPLFVIAVDLDI